MRRLFRTNRMRAFTLLVYFTCSLVPSHSTVLIGLDVSPQHGDNCWSRKVGQKVMLLPAMQLLTVTSYLFEVLLAKIPGRPWCLTPHISLNFPPDGIFTFIFPGPLLLSKTTISLQEPFFSALPLSFRPQDPSFPTLNRKTLQKQMSDQPHI